MKMSSWNSFYAGLGIYLVCIAISALPIFSNGLDAKSILELLTAATAASLFVAVYRGSRLARQVRDSAGVFVQALLGISVCAGLYSLVSNDARPEVLFTVFLLWTAVGLMHLTPARVAALFLIYVGIFANEFSSTLFSTTTPQARAEAIYMLVLSAIMAGFMYWRARDYTRVRNEKARLREENGRQAEEIEDAKRRIHELTVQDIDTIALKYPYFRDELRRCKERADRSRETFSIGLVSVDHFAALCQAHGEGVTKQLTREVVERIASTLVGLGFSDEHGNRHPVGKVGEGLFGIILSSANLRGAQACAGKLQSAIGHRAFRTLAGPMNMTVTVGLVEYFPGESVDELVQSVGQSLERARLQEVGDFHVTTQPRAVKAAPVKAATGVHDLRILHEKEYESPLH